MQSSVYVSLSAQLTLQRRLESIANNVANLATPGFRSEQVSFAAAASAAGPELVDYASKGHDFISTRSGSVSKTENPLDVAINGDAWFAVATSSGVAYTRDGRFRISSGGDLETINGQKVLDIGGATIQIDPAGGRPVIARDGTISQNARSIGSIGLFLIDPTSSLRRGENASVVPSKPAVPQLDFNQVSVLQGYIEQSNVDPIQEMTKLIALQRMFDSISNSVNEIESSMSDAIRTLAS